MTSHYVMVTNKLYLYNRNNDYIVLCKLGSHTISGCRDTGVGPPEPPPPRSWKAKKRVNNRVKRISASVGPNLFSVIYFLTREGPVGVRLRRVSLYMSDDDQQMVCR